MRRTLFSRGHVLTSLVLLALLAVVASSCTSPKDSLGTNASPCFRALALARDAVHDRGHFSGVRYVSTDALSADLKHQRQPNEVPPALTTIKVAACVVAYTGMFDKGQVDKGWLPEAPTGRYALVIVAARRNVLLATIVLRDPPLRLGRVFPLSR